MSGVWKLPDPPVTLWFELGDSCAGIRSGLGPVDGVLAVALVDGHCPGRAKCTVLESRPGRLVLLTCAMLTQLKDSRRARWSGDDKEERVLLTMDHTRTGEPLALEFLVIPVCWRDRPESIDFALVVGVFVGGPGADGRRT